MNHRTTTPHPVFSSLFVVRHASRSWHLRGLPGCALYPIQTKGPSWRYSGRLENIATIGHLGKGSGRECGVPPLPFWQGKTDRVGLEPRISTSCTRKGRGGGKRGPKIVSAWSTLDVANITSPEICRVQILNNENFEKKFQGFQVKTADCTTRSY